MPYDKFVYDILTASGSNLENPPAAYYKILRDPDAAMENTTQLFLAVRFNCNKCHDHPFERWTQDQYYHLAAFFAQVGRTEDPKFKGQKLGGTAVEGGNAAGRDHRRHQRRRGQARAHRQGDAAAVPLSRIPACRPTASRAASSWPSWITSKDNPYFAKSYVNRLWSYLLGVGIIEPVDDIRAGNPPTNPKLLDRLTEEFIDSGFNVRHMIKTICKSRIYQHSLATNKWNQDDEINYSHALARRLPAEVLYDAIHRVTGSQAGCRACRRAPGPPQLLDSSVRCPAASWTCSASRRAKAPASASAPAA